MPAELRAEVEARAGEVLDAWRAEVLRPPPESPESNHLTELWGKWHGSAYLFGGTYASPGPRALSPTFRVKYARMTSVGGGRFDLHYMRHTGQWWPLGQTVPLEEALRRIRTEPHFRPY